MSIINIIRGIVTYFFFISLLILLFYYILLFFLKETPASILAIIFSILLTFKFLRVNWGIRWFLFLFYVFSNFLNYLRLFNL